MISYITSRAKLQKSRTVVIMCPTDPFTVSELQNPGMGEFYVALRWILKLESCERDGRVDIELYAFLLLLICF